MPDQRATGPSRPPRAPRSRPARLRLCLICLAALTALGVPSCSSTPPILEPPDQAAIPGTAVGRTNHLRSGEVTYRLGDVQKTPRDIRVDLVIQNGTSRNYSGMMFRVIVHGAAGEMAAVRVPAGSLAAGRARTVSARFPPFEFEVRDITVELIWVTDKSR